jgi:hypothetical protein
LIHLGLRACPFLSLTSFQLFSVLNKPENGSRFLWTVSKQLSDHTVSHFRR